MLSPTHPDEQPVNAGGDGRFWLRLLELIDGYLHKPAPTNLCGQYSIESTSIDRNPKQTIIIQIEFKSIKPIQDL
jgi:hypothetical protein